MRRRMAALVSLTGAATAVAGIRALRGRPSRRAGGAVERRIGIMGRIDLGETMVDGQTVKTRVVYRHLADRFGAGAIRTVDTLDYRHHPLRVAKDAARCLAACDDVVVLLSDNGRRFFFPVLALAASARGTRVFHNLIGGRLADDIERDPSGRLVRYLNAFQVNWVESRALVARLAELGVRNAAYLPNFKDLDAGEARLDAPTGRPARLCTFSRVVPGKGIENAVRTVARLNEDAGAAGPVAVLDIYGPVDEDYEEAFRALIESAPHARYMGAVKPEQGVATIRDYHALLFPTEFWGEGIPGTIVDAMGAGLPVIASHWAFYSEMLTDGVTGLGYDFERPEDLRPTIESFLALPRQEVEAMRRAMHERAEAYTADAVFERIAEALTAHP
ncbi:glycosyltransferase family 4 protein [Actinomyces marmotae]|uniref:Glycosyltransferase n=1 Tax=Actinomyces marmotae TaxID=2737173 RepID=A0A6M8BA01_9ACTO|nr:glycosyltransferase [Actinomyces marmotae]QKD80053.1 glycosyltransferase [Actinomyces marmotae]